MMSVPSNEDLVLELESLSSYLYDCIDMADALGPTRKEYDRLRSKRWCPSTSLLPIFGTTVDKVGWNALLNAYGFLHPTLSQVQRAAYARKGAMLGTHIAVEDESYPELVVLDETMEVVRTIISPDGQEVRYTWVYHTVR